MTWMRYLLLAAGIVIGIALLQFLLGIYPQQPGTDRTPATYGLPYNEVSFTTSDNLTLAGWWIPAENETNRTIIVGHGYPFDKSRIIQEVTFLHDTFNLLLFDFRYFGDSEGSHTTLGHDEVRDVDAAIRYIEEHHPSHSIGAYGFSLSAAIFLQAADPRLNAVVADSPFASLSLQLDQVYWLFPGPLKKPFTWTTSLLARTFLGFWPSEVSPVAAVAGSDTPLLLIHGTADSQIPSWHSEQIYENANTSITDLWLVDGADHLQAQRLHPEEYRERVEQFFTTHLGRQ